MEIHFEWWKMKTFWCTFFLVIVAKSFPKFQLFSKGGRLYCDFDNCLRRNCSLNFSHSHPIRSYILQGVWPGVTVWLGVSVICPSHVSSTRFLPGICTGSFLHLGNWFMMSDLQYSHFFPRCPIAAFVLVLGALPEITITSKSLPGFYWGQIWTDFWWHLCSFRIVLVFWMFSRHV